MKMIEDYNENFDDVDIESIRYGDEELSENAGYSIDEIDNSDNSFGNTVETDGDLLRNKPSFKYNYGQDAGWKTYNLDKEYPGEEFDLTKAQELFFASKDDGTSDLKAQREAVRYAAYFAKNNNNEAKNFIIYVIQICDDPMTLDMAKTVLYLFLRNYVRTEVRKFYNKQPIDDSQKAERAEDAVNECFSYIFDKLENYDPEKGMITTFFASKILRGVILEYESKRKGHGSKQTTKMDIIVSRACKQITNIDKEEPTLWRIANYTGKKTEAILNSMARITAEANTQSLENDEAGRNVLLYKKQKTFISPEEHVEKISNLESLIGKLDSLTDLERELFLAAHGLKVEDGEIVECEKIKPPALAEKYDMKTNEVKHTISVARRKLANKISTESGRRVDDHDRLLSGRAMTFMSDEPDDDVAETYDGILEIYK